MTDQRVRFADSDNLISTTTADSHITYCNDSFCKVAGYQQDELLDKPHNVIRHADMPKPAFAQLWQHIQAGSSWMGLVKNRCKESGHYWVSAFVTPIMDKNGEVFEYQSVRTQPNDEQISRASKLYQKLQQGEAKVRRLALCSWQQLGILATLGSLVLTAWDVISSATLLATAIPLLVISLLLSIKFKARLATLKQIAQQNYHNPLMEMPYTGHCDDLSSIELAMLMKKAELRAVTARANETSDSILDSAKQEVANSQAIDEELSEQSNATDAMAVSAEEMLASIDEVSQQAKQSSEFTQDASITAMQGAKTIDEAVATVNSLSQQLDDSRQALGQLYNDVESIETILGMIQGIAEQTNLLALNAAIEAARAGEHGRGFAVVADEVRALSGKTSSSVDDIRSKIEVLQATVNKTGNLMEQGIAASDSSVAKSQQSKQAFQAIVNDLHAIGEQSTSTSQAIAEQVQVTQGMTEHVHRMKEAVDSTKLLSDSSVGRTQKLVSSLESLQRLVKQFSQA
ncbi:methyl-accepting chemotaxis protein [Agarivorans sp. OAG1]|uniref:methyl-accepting chemotaxis protein n=2 Tax=Agarivorans TaxID=261825 RepID=UPI002B2F34BD|nr:methyl-accepting chemotaxis protein [Agarivorans sp. OAG1]